MSNDSIKIDYLRSNTEAILRKNFVKLFKDSPIPDEEILENLGLYISRQNLSRILFINDLYKQIINIHGIVVEFGVRWGKNLVLFESLRGIYEPFNHNRKIVGFDTFSGFPSVHMKDGDGNRDFIGGYSVTENYDKYLEQILDYHEKESPISHIKKYELVKGDATFLIDDYLDKNPQTIIALAYFDFDIYEPTKKCLESIKDHLTKGSIVGFDELNVKKYPGETLALKETLGLDKYRILRMPYSSVSSYIIIE